MKLKGIEKQNYLIKTILLNTSNIQVTMLITFRLVFKVNWTKTTIILTLTKEHYISKVKEYGINQLNILFNYKIDR